MDLMEEVRELKATIKQKDQKTEWMEQKINDLEQYSHVNETIITGLDTKHRSYARAAATDQQGEDAPPEERHT